MNKIFQMLIPLIFILIATSSVAQSSNKDTLQKLRNTSPRQMQPLKPKMSEDSVDTKQLPKVKPTHAPRPVRTRQNKILKDTVKTKISK